MATVTIRWYAGGSSFINEVDIAPYGARVSVPTDAGVSSGDTIIINFLDRNAVNIPGTFLDFTCT